MDYSRTHGWYVRVYLTNKRVHSRFFADRKNGGRLEALSVAMAYRDNYKRAHSGELAPYCSRKRSKPTVRNTSGVLGVSFYYKLARDKVTREPVYQASWSSIKNGKLCKHTQSFYVKHYPTNRDAFDAATKFRKNWEATVK